MHVSKAVYSMHVSKAVYSMHVSWQQFQRKNVLSKVLTNL